MMSWLGNHVARATGGRRSLRCRLGSTLVATPLEENFAAHMSLGKSHTHVVWKDGHKSKFLNAWLRDHCQCSSCFDKTTAQRSSDTLAIGDASNIRSTEAHTSNQQLSLSLEYGNGKSHTCSFPLDWLRSNCYSPAGKEERRQEQHQNSFLWDPTRLTQLCIENNETTKETTDLLYGLPVTPHEMLPQFPGVLRSQLHRYGIAFVSHVKIPEQYEGDSNVNVVEQCKTIVETTVRDYLGFPRETLWGTLWDTAPSHDAPDTAYTNIALRPHVDCTYLRDPPELQIFLCAEESDDHNGGSSTFLDGFHVAMAMYKKSPEAFHFFATTRLGFQCIQDGVHSVAYGTVFEIDPSICQRSPTPLDVVRFRYNNDDRSVINFLDANDVEMFYHYVPLLLELLRDEQFVLRTRLQKGTMAIVNNHRVLHGRESFEGTGRNLVGCYAELSEAVLPNAVRPTPPPNNQL